MADLGSIGASRIDVHVFDEFQGVVSPGWLRVVAARALAVEVERQGGGHGSSLGVVVADDQAVRELNLQHRRIDETTDVLSFAFGRPGEYHEGVGCASDPAGDAKFVLPRGQTSTLGEVVISYHQAVRQAGEAGIAVESELAHLLVHGVLHVLGYDHQTPREYVAMKSLENSVLADIPGMGACTT